MKQSASNPTVTRRRRPMRRPGQIARKCRGLQKTAAHVTVRAKVVIDRHTSRGWEAVSLSPHWLTASANLAPGESFSFKLKRFEKEPAPPCSDGLYRATWFYEQRAVSMDSRTPVEPPEVSEVIASRKSTIVC
jgi:hypothetical protein